MIPWNINHFRPINAQLSEGVRFLHLKICNFGAPGLPGQWGQMYFVNFSGGVALSLTKVYFEGLILSGTSSPLTGAPTMDLGTVHFQHRGYTTRETAT